MIIGDTMIKNLVILIIPFMLISIMFAGCLDESDSDDNSDEDTEYYPPHISIREPDNNAAVSDVVVIEVRIFPERPNVEIQYSIDDKLMEISYSTIFLL